MLYELSLPSMKQRILLVVECQNMFTVFFVIQVVRVLCYLMPGVLLTEMS